MNPEDLMRHARNLSIPAGNDMVEITRGLEGRWGARFLDMEAIDYSEGRFNAYPHLRRDGKWIAPADVPKGEAFMADFTFDSLDALLGAAGLPSEGLDRYVTHYSIPKGEDVISIDREGKDKWSAMFIDAAAARRSKFIDGPPRLLHDGRWTPPGVHPSPDTWPISESIFESLEALLQAAGL